MNRFEIKALLEEVGELDALYVKMGQLKGYFTLCQNSIGVDGTIKLAEKYIRCYEFYNLFGSIEYFEAFIECSLVNIQTERKVRTDRIKALQDQPNNYQNLSNEPTRD